jgi:hypothetical protein
LPLGAGDFFGYVIVIVENDAVAVVGDVDGAFFVTDVTQRVLFVLSFCS